LDLYNIASGREVTMGELVETLREVTEYEGEICWDASKPVGIPRRTVDNRRLKSIRGDFPTTSLADGLSATVKWYREHY
jgi:GDP-L-fucose synthase